METFVEKERRNVFYLFDENFKQFDIFMIKFTTLDMAVQMNHFPSL